MDGITQDACFCQRVLEDCQGDLIENVNAQRFIKWLSLSNVLAEGFQRASCRSSSPVGVARRVEKVLKVLFRGITLRPCQVLNDGMPFGRARRRETPSAEAGRGFPIAPLYPFGRILVCFPF